jgi:hypothetical protein
MIFWNNIECTLITNRSINLQCSSCYSSSVSKKDKIRFPMSWWTLNWEFICWQFFSFIMFVFFYLFWNIHCQLWSLLFVESPSYIYNNQVHWSISSCSWAAVFGLHTNYRKFWACWCRVCERTWAYNSSTKWNRACIRWWWRRDGWCRSWGIIW